MRVLGARMLDTTRNKQCQIRRLQSWDSCAAGCLFPRTLLLVTGSRLGTSLLPSWQAAVAAELLPLQLCGELRLVAVAVSVHSNTLSL